MPARGAGCGVPAHRNQYHSSRKTKDSTGSKAEPSLLKLQKKILLVLVPLTVLPLLVLGWSAYTQLLDTAKERTFGQMSTLLRQVSLQTQSQIRTGRANASLFASGSLVGQYLSTGDDHLSKTLLHEGLLKQF